MNNPTLKIAIEIDDKQKEYLEVIKNQIKERLVDSNQGYFSIIDESNENISIAFSPNTYSIQMNMLALEK
ncbi:MULTISPECIES: hypothetical protein [unclassified Niallia]|uniref:hypothetical protein n=1 Tax=unclassified Niallia TaxID=2837522 RepID=UPI001EDBFFCF|nr:MULTISPECIES: hypothetical protein [unclassified Niallia]MCM3034194.1 hypothetical protein [Niallia sp. MER 6]UPO90328.1 hypothetical protein L8T27_019850 [Niallia sp. Man26]